MNKAKKALLILVTVATGFSQTHDNKDLHFGLFIGGNASGIYGQYMTHEIFKTGLNGGVTLIRKIADNLDFRSGVYLIGKGFKTRKIKSADYKDRNERYYFLSNYLEVPFLIQFKGSVIEIESIWMAGFGAAVNISNVGKTKVDDKSYSVDIQKNIRPYDITLILGTNKMAGHHLNVDFRASAGLIPYNTHADFLGKRHLSLMASLGYIF
ncbi:MAG: outer membrane beta-barrel protein [Candidatus Marinimicrobia bacterium]|nr:outer membrane beta-barrel protein [Candidatus Neomarinimicrobiota bacterium]